MKFYILFLTIHLDNNKFGKNWFLFNIQLKTFSVKNNLLKNLENIIIHNNT